MKSDPFYVYARKGRLPLWNVSLPEDVIEYLGLNKNYEPAVHAVSAEQAVSKVVKDGRLGAKGSYKMKAPSGSTTKHFCYVGKDGKECFIPCKDIAIPARGDLKPKDIEQRTPRILKPYQVKLPYSAPTGSRRCRCEMATGIDGDRNHYVAAFSKQQALSKVLTGTSKHFEKDNRFMYRKDEGRGYCFVYTPYSGKEQTVHIDRIVSEVTQKHPQYRKILDFLHLADSNPEPHKNSALQRPKQLLLF